MHDEHSGRADNGCNRSDVANETEFEIVIERRVPRIGRRGEEQRVTVGRCPHECLRGNVAARTRPVLDEELLAEPLRQPLADEARVCVVDPARRKAGDDPHRTRRVALRGGKTRRRPHRGGGRGEMQKVSAWECHGFSDGGEGSRNTKRRPPAGRSATNIPSANLCERGTGAFPAFDGAYVHLKWSCVST